MHLWIVRAVKREGVYERGLVILASGKHNDVGSRSLRGQSPVVRVFAVGGLLEEAHSCRGHSTKVAACVRRDDAEKALTCFLGEVGFFEDALCGVNIWKIEGGPGVARVEDGREPHAGLKRLHDPEVDLVVDEVACFLIVYWVNNLIVPILLVAIQVFRLSSVACAQSQPAAE